MFEVESVYYILLGALGSTVIWLLLGPRVAGKGFIWKVKRWEPDTDEAFELIIEKVVSYLSDDERFNGFMNKVWNWLNTPSIKTGGKTKVYETNEAGEKVEVGEQETILTPVQNFMNELARFIILKLRASLGGKSKATNDALAADLADPNSPLASSLGGIFPRLVERGRKGGSEGIMGIIEDLGLGPIVRDYIKAKLQSSIGGSGGEGSW